MNETENELYFGVDMSPQKNKTNKGWLYLVATPIGNLADMSARAVKVLREVDFIAAEDTRNTARLLSYFDIQKPMISYFEHNKRSRGELICERLLNGEACALVTDAGTPAISDPGEDIVALCAQRGIPVTSIPGACAAIIALTLSGLPTGKFCFEGFLAADRGDRRKRLEHLRTDDRTLIFHEAPHKLCATLADMCEIFGAERRISLCRELTKLNEDVCRTTLGEAVELYKSNSPRGEYVLVVDGSSDTCCSSGANELLLLSVEEHVEHYLKSGMSKKDAIKAVARERSIPRNDVYMRFAND